MMMLPSTSSPLAVTATFDGVPTLTLVGFSETASDATTPLNVRVTLFVVPATTLNTNVPVESRFPPPLTASKSFTVNVSEPIGAASVPVQTLVQLTVTEAEPGVTETVADSVEGETYAGRRATLDVRAGTIIVNCTIDVSV
jgi:hypothetical protein